MKRGKRKSICACLLFLAVCLLCSLLPGRKRAQAAGEVTFLVECGYDGYGKFGRNIPFYAEIISDRSFQGVLRIIVPANNGTENYAYEYPISVEEGTALGVRGEIPLVSAYTTFSFQVLSEKSRVLAEEQAKVRISGRELTELFVGVISENEDAASAFQGVNLGEYTDSSFPYVRTRAFALGRQDIESIHYGLDCLDVIVIDRSVSAMLTDGQKDTLYRWVCDGGSLVAEVRSGQYFFPEDEYPVTEEVEARPYLWVRTQKVKKGTAGYFTLKVEDMDLMEFAVDNNVIPGSVISKVCTAQTITKIVEEDHYYNGETKWISIQNMLDTAMGRRLPRISVYAAVIILYLLLAGPAVFYVLRRRDQAALTGKAVTALAIVFSALIYLMGIRTRFRDPIIRYASIWTLDGRLVSEEAYIDAKASTSNPYQITLLPDYSVCPVSTDSRYYYEKVDEQTVIRDFRIELYHGEEATTITMRQSAPFESEYFKLEREWEDRDLLGIDADLSYFNETLHGKVYNETQKDFENVILVLRNGIYLLGDLESGESMDITKAEKLYFYPNSCKEAAKRITGFETAGYQMNSENKEYAILSQKTNLLEYYLRQLDTDSGSNAVLFAFLSADSRGSFQAGSEYPVYGATAVSKNVTLDTSFGGMVYQNLTSKEIVNIDDDISYSQATGSTYSASIRLQYELGSIEELRAVRFAPAEVADDNPDYQAFSGKMYFYNPLTLVYEQVDLGRKNFWIADLEKYLMGRDGKYSMIVQYSSDIMDMEQYREIVLPLVSAIRRK